MCRFISTIFVVALTLSLTVLFGCSNDSAKPSTQTTTGGATTQTANPAAQTSNPAAASSSGSLRNEKWLLGVWEASVPKGDSGIFNGKKIVLKISDVMLVSNESVKGNPTGRYSYSGSLIWDTGSAERTLVFDKTNKLSGDSTLGWSYLSPGANQFTENISMRIYDTEWQFELDWGPQISKAGSTVTSLGFYGDIMNLDTSEREVFDPNHMITFKQTSSNAPPMVSSPASSPTSTSGATGGPKPSSTTPSSTATTPPAGQGTGDIWSNVPVYPGAQKADDTGFSITVPGDPSYSQIEWRFFASTDDYAKVVDFYKKQMPASGWNKMMWVESDEMSWGAFEKNNEARLVLVYVVNDEGKAGINIQSAAK